MNRYKVSILTLGCRVNQYESDYITKELSKMGIEVVPFCEGCDAYIINTCTVTSESDRKSKQFIRKCIKSNPNAKVKVIVTGCYSQINQKEASEIPGVTFVCDNNSKSQIPSIIKNLLNNEDVTYIKTGSSCFDIISVGASPTRTRAFIKIEDGCDSKCAYCIIPKARGNVRSAPVNHILDEIKAVSESGCCEVVLTGIETASYGKDLSNGESLASLLVEANKIKGIERIRLGSLDPSSITKDFVDKIKGLEKVMPHFHLSMQSGNTKTLNEMRRKYSIEMAKANIEYLRSKIKDVQLSCDIITGFPNETDKDFENTYSFFKEQQFLHHHIFPYSKRAGTVAATMENQVDECVKKERLHKLEALEKKIKPNLLKEYISKYKTGCVLFESTQNGYACGHLPNFMEVKLETNNDLSGQLVKVEFISSDDKYIYAKTI